MKKIILTTAIFSMLITTVFGQARLQRFLFTTTEGIILELIVKGEEEIQEDLPENSREIFKQSLEASMKGFNGETFDLDEITVPEKELEEHIINTKAIFDDYNKEKLIISAK